MIDKTVEKKTLTKDEKNYGVPLPNGKYPRGCHPNSMRNLTPRPKGCIQAPRKQTWTTLTSLLRRISHQEYRNGKSVGEFIAQVLSDEAAKGNMEAMRMYWERLDGKVPDQVILSTMQRNMVEQSALIAEGLVAAVLNIAPKYVKHDKIAEMEEELRKEIKKELKRVPNLFEFENMTNPKPVQGAVVDVKLPVENTETIPDEESVTQKEEIVTPLQSEPVNADKPEAAQ